MTIVSKPKITFNIEPPQLDAGITAHRTLLVAPYYGSGAAYDGVVQTDVTDSAISASRFGPRSAVHNAYLAFREINKVSQLDILPVLHDSGGDAATATIVVSGTATETRDMYITVASAHLYRVKVSVVSGDTATAIGVKIDTALSALDTLPCTVTNATGTVTLTWATKGTFGNGNAIRIEEDISGTAVTCVGFASGATDPSITGLLDAIAGRRYQTIIWDASFAIGTLVDELDARFNVENDILDGVGIVTLIDTYANIISALDNYNPHKHQLIKAV